MKAKSGERIKKDGKTEEMTRKNNLHFEGLWPRIRISLFVI